MGSIRENFLRLLRESFSRRIFDLAERGAGYDDIEGRLRAARERLAFLTALLFVALEFYLGFGRAGIPRVMKLANITFMLWDLAALLLLLMGRLRLSLRLLVYGNIAFCFLFNTLIMRAATEYRAPLASFYLFCLIFFFILLGAAFFLGRKDVIAAGVVVLAYMIFTFAMMNDRAFREGIPLPFVIFALTTACLAVFSSALERVVKRLTEMNRGLKSEVEERTGELRASETRYRKFVETAPEGIAVTDETGRMLFANRRLAELTGRREAALVGVDIVELLGPTFAREEGTFLARLGSGPPLVEPISIPNTSGRESRVILSAALLEKESGAVEGALFFFTDIGRGHELAEYLQYQKRLTDLYEEMHRRIGNDLHDSMGQDLTALRILMNLLSEEAAGTAVAAKAREAEAMVKNMAKHFSNVLKEIYPSELESEDLAAGLGLLADRVTDNFGIPCHFDARGEGGYKPGSRVVGLHLFRIAQEAVTNAVKHKQAGEVVVSLERTSETFALIVRGTSANRISANKRGKGTGLGRKIMESRAAAIGATIRLEESEQGCRLECSLPLERFLMKASA